MFYARVFDRQTGEHLGYLCDITAEGIMIISDDPIEVGRKFSLRLDLPADIYNQPMLKFDVQSKWCAPDIDPNFFNTGFAMVDIQPHDLAVIDRIVEDFEVRK
jgi:hypothetical protein